MARNPRTIRLPEQLEQDLEREFARRGVKEWSAGVVDLLSEAVRMRRVPGIIFVDSRTGRHPVIAGTGLDVWEVIATWKTLGREDEKLREAYDWLTEPQLRAALNYYAVYPQEIDDRLRIEESWTPERVRRELPFASLGPVLGGEGE
ncbi:MAG: DUF433 domain-containing protein [Gemmatimonadota bacterium]|nr:DUF433 domain-containing protein [Gemmatimonadota bacterium]MDQ3606604.1 DUF433 domain-containing protein [Gemmatimonadota bacterium]